MKLFRQLLVAPAALGLMAPLSATAAEVNINGVANYSDSAEQVYQTTAQFSDVVPGDWAYTALQNLSDSYGCVDNSYTNNLKSGQALTRYEAAALVNACLEGGLMASGEGMTSEASRLANEFGSEMAILKGRVDGLEYRLKEINAKQFSASTLMSGNAVFSLGAVQGDANGEKVHSIYSYGIDLTTSYSGRDSLDASIIAGNAASEPLADLDSAENTTGNALTLNNLSYTFPVGNYEVTAFALGMESEDVVSATLSTYSDSFRISNLRYATEGAESGPGIGVTRYFDNNWNASIALIADDGESGTAGIATQGGDDVVTASVGYDSDNWGGGLLYTGGDDSGSIENYDVWALGFYWNPESIEGLGVSLSLEAEDNTTSNDNDAITLALDYEGWGPGTLSTAYQSVETNDQTLGTFEIYYNWEIADGIAVQPGFYTNEIDGDDDETGVVVETYFKF
jgi:hypothetical protein